MPEENNGFKPRKIRLKKPPPVAVFEKKFQDELSIANVDVNKHPAGKGDKEDYIGCSAKSEFPNETMQNPKSIVDQVFQQFICEKIGNMKGSEKIEVLDTIISESDNSTSKKSHKGKKHHRKKKHKIDKDTALKHEGDGVWGKEEKKKHKKKLKKRSKSRERNNKDAGKDQSNKVVEGRNVVDADGYWKRKCLRHDSSEIVSVERSKSKCHYNDEKHRATSKEERKREHENRSCSSYRHSKDGVLLESDSRKAIFDESGMTTDEVNRFDDNDDMNTYHKQQFNDTSREKKRKLDKPSSDVHSHDTLKEEVEHFDCGNGRGAERRRKLHDDISDLQARLLEIKGSRERSISKKQEDLHKERREKRRSDRKRTKKHGPSEKHSKSHKLELKITAPIELQSHDTSITPIHSPTLDHKDKCYQHPEQISLFVSSSAIVKTEQENKKFRHPERHLAEERQDFRSAYLSRRVENDCKIDCEDVLYHSPEHQLFPRGRANFDRPRSTPSIDNPTCDCGRQHEVEREKCQLYSSEREITMDRELGPAYAKDIIAAQKNLSLKSPGKGNEPKFYRSLKDIEPERDIGHLIIEAEEELRKTAELGNEGRKFMNVRARELKDQEVYDILLREGRDGLLRLKEIENEKMQQREHKSEEEEKLKRERAEKKKLALNARKDSDTVEFGGSFPLEKDILIDEADIETKEREMIREIQAKREKKNSAKKAEREVEKQMQNMEEERKQLERELQEILNMSDDEYVQSYGMAGGLRRKEDPESGEVTSDSDAYEVIEENAKPDLRQQSSVMEVQTDIVPPSTVQGYGIAVDRTTPAFQAAEASKVPLQEIMLPVNTASPAVCINTVNRPPPEVTCDMVKPTPNARPPPPGSQSPPPLLTVPHRHPPAAEATEPLHNAASIYKKLGKMMGIKISQTSAALISAAVPEETNKVPSKEDGEVSESSYSAATSPADVKQGWGMVSSSDDDILPDSSGSISDSDEDSTEKKQKKKKKKKKAKKTKKEKSKDRPRSRKESRSPRRRPRRSYSPSKSRSRSHERGFDKSRGVWRSRSRSRDRYRRGSRRGHRSRSRERFEKVYSSRGHDYSSKIGGHRDRPRRSTEERSRQDKSSTKDVKLNIDKAKLREIAIRNAVSSLKSGNAPPVQLKPDALAQLRAGGKSLCDLTDYCKRIAEKAANKAARGSDESDPDMGILQPGSEEEGQPFIHHPFKMKEAPIVMNIRNSRQLPILTPREKVEQSSQLRIEFPVSSGTQHRAKEWIPVEKTEPQSSTAHLAQIPAAAPSKNILPPQTLTPAPEALPPPPLPPPPQNIISQQTVAEEILAAREADSQAEKLANEAAKKAELAAIAAAAKEPVRLPVAPEDRVFPDVPRVEVSIGDLVSRRLSAMRKLQDNPHDVEATSQLYEAQQNMNQWAESKHLPGQFLGSTGAQVLSAQEIIGNPRNQAWARKDQFTRAAPVSGGIGKFLLQKMGWSEGEGLGKDKTGQLEPLKLDVKMDRKGLNTEGETGKKVTGAKASVAAAASIPAASLSGRGKHPVSALMELVKRKKWTSSFDIVHESGPPHKKNFLFKAHVNGVDYQPTVASNNKKHAKMMAAVVCLQALGIPCQPVDC